MFNTIIITGTIGEPKKTEKGAVFDIYISLRDKKNITVQTAGKTAQSVLKYCKKGDLVSVSGTLCYTKILLPYAQYKNFYVQAANVSFGFGKGGEKNEN